MNECIVLINWWKVILFLFIFWIFTRISNWIFDKITKPFFDKFLNSEESE